MARTAGVLPPANPATNCAAAKRLASNAAGALQTINTCRASEGVGPLTLPRNWTALTGSQQVFVLIDLERVNRGLRPAAGMSSLLDTLAMTGARIDSDPRFPSLSESTAGSIWFGLDSAAGLSAGTVPLLADAGWMYDDGYGSNNEVCTTPHATGCWGHRDNILLKVPAAGTFAVGAASLSDGSTAAELLAAPAPLALTFTWAHELRSFAQAPAVERLGATSARRRGRRRRA